MPPNVEGFSETVVERAMKELRRNNPQGSYLPTPADVRDACEKARKFNQSIGLEDPEQRALDAAAEAERLEIKRLQTLTREKHAAMLKERTAAAEAQHMAELVEKLRKRDEERQASRTH